jgi:zinc/manganese transport system ATP-binding protein
MGQVNPPAVPIALRQVSFGWRGRPLAVRSVSGCFAPGTMTAVVGPNGAGKSTLIKGIMGLLRPREGELKIEGNGRSRLAWLPQIHELDQTAPVTVLELVALGAWRRVSAWRRFPPKEIERALAILDSLGLTQIGDRTVACLSGGQMQRVLFARLLMQDASVLLLDEPFTAVDAHATEALMKVLCALHTQGRSVIAVLHDLTLVRRYFPRTLLLSGAVVAWQDTASALNDSNLCQARAWNMREFT